MIDPNKSRAAALSLFDASCQAVRELIVDPQLANPEWPVLEEALAKVNAAARHVVRINASIKELEDLRQS